VTLSNVTLRNSAGIEVSIISYGSAIQELWAPDRDGRRANLVLGFADLDGYTSEPNHYFGAIVGRFANRIAMGRTLRDSEIMASMGSKGDPWDNASAESCMSTIKNELVKRRTFQTRDQARLALFRYIESFHNPLRRDSSPGMHSPKTYEQRYSKDNTPASAA
jgi:hypothetical protein